MMKHVFVIFNLIFPISSNIILTNGTFDKIYVNNASNDLNHIFFYSYDRIKYERYAVRVYITSHNSTLDFPLFCVIRKENNIISWQIPLKLANNHTYQSVSRTLCSDLKKNVTTYGNSSVAMKTLEFMVEITSFSQNPISFSLLLTLEDGYLLRTGQHIQFTTTPSQPVYFLYLFPPNLTSVKVLAASPDKHCAILSIQSVPCPVFDIDENVRFEGLYQTMTTQAAISISRSNYQYSGFFVVFVVKSTDEECNGGANRKAILTPFHPNLDVQEGSNSYGENASTSRVKIITLRISENLTRGAYLKATLIPLGVFLLLYLVTFAFTFGYYIKDKRREFDTWLIGNPDASSDRPLTASAHNNYNSVNQPVSRVEREPMEENSETDDDVLEQSDRSSTNGSDSEQPYPVGNSSFYDKQIPNTLNLHSQNRMLAVSDLSRKKRRRLHKKYIMYHWNLFPIAIFYTLPVVQLVYTYEKIIDMTGNQDLCYYNFLCAHPLGNLMSFNNIYSNLGYVMLGALFFCMVWRRDMIHRKTLILNGAIEKLYGIPYHFGLFYAMAIALCIEGLLSACYHVCPNYSNFQFDTSFMYIITGLTMLKIYQTRHPDISASSYYAYLAFAFIVVISVVGVIEGNDLFWYSFALGLITICLLLSLHIYYMGQWKLDGRLLARFITLGLHETPHNPFPKYPDRLVLLVLANLINIAMAIYGLCERPKNFPAYLLGILILDLLLYLAFYIIMKLRYGERIRSYTVIFIVLASLIWTSALYFFLHGNISWQVTPAQSREKNGNCVLLDFYDIHDVWHFLSALGLFFSFMTLLTLDDDLLNVKRDRIPVF